MAMAVAAIGSIALNTVHSPDYMVASGLKTPGFKHFSIPATTSFGRDLNSGLPSSKSLKKLRLFSAQTEADTTTTSAQGKIPFGYTRKDVLLIGLGLTGFGFGLKYGLEFIGLDSTKAGNVVQLVMVLGLTVGWISSYIFRVSSKDMTYAQQLRDYENKVMQKRLEELPEAELEVLLAQVEEEKQRLQNTKRDGFPF
jgi:hypothetical protein